MPAVVAGEPDASESDAGETDAGAAADDAGSAPPALKTKDVAPAAAAERSRGKKVTRRKEPTRRKQPSRRKPPSVDKPGKPVLAESAGPAPTGDATDLYYAGVQQLRSGDFNRAVASLSASQRLRSSSRTLAKLGQAYFDSGRLKEAEQTLRAAGRRPEAMLLLATLYQQTSRVDRTRKTYQAFLAHHPDHARAGWVRNMLKQL
jgi:TolA-binding protein